MKTLREHSRNEWHPQPDPELPSNASLEVGCLQRIADATESMALSYASLIEERDNYKRLFEIERAEALRLSRSNSSLRGTITRLKRKAKR